MSRPIECLHAGQGAIGGKGHLHTHPFDEFLLIMEGLGQITIGPRVYDVAGGDMLYYPIDTLHQEVSQAPSGAAYIYFTMKGQPPDPIGPVTRDSSGRLRVLASWLLEEMAAPRQHRQRAMDALLQALLVELAKLSGTTPAGPIDEVRRYLRDHLEETHAVDALAGRAAMSRYHFIRTYKRIAGHPPMEDLRRMRVQAACDLLLTSTLPLKEISRRVGFYDEFHFSRVFRKYHHVPPGSFRRKS